MEHEAGEKVKKPAHKIIENIFKASVIFDMAKFLLTVFAIVVLLILAAFHIHLK